MLVSINQQRGNRTIKIMIVRALVLKWAQATYFLPALRETLTNFQVDHTDGSLEHHKHADGRDIEFCNREHTYKMGGFTQ